ncbi:DUF4142 domain-containing protein [Dyella sp.]|jgi:putative membrane protein|uniref:DUF4142 domain-containing protein n=1 Tax=Dyella sp. TaxID=1869338 RepID=UPI002D767AF7|nr:DUF4142 domain-containing protein [Dyella sp.]HET6433092.1 DUF4142 domain-containing protein [Dyella sp.]
MKRALAPFLILSALAGGAQAQVNTPTDAPSPPGRSQPQATSTATPSSADSTFVRKASEGNAKEIALGKIAQDKGNSSAVRQYGQQMVHDHSAANQKLQSIAQANHLQMSPPEPEQGRTAQEFRAMQGQGFDKAFAQRMVQDHQKAIDLYQKELREGRDPAIQSYARGTLPTLQRHLQNAWQLPGGRSGSDHSNGMQHDQGSTGAGMEHGNDNGMNQGGMDQDTMGHDTMDSSRSGNAAGSSSDNGMNSGMNHSTDSSTDSSMDRGTTGGVYNDTSTGTRTGVNGGSAMDAGSGTPGSDTSVNGGINGGTRTAQPTDSRYGRGTQAGSTTGTTDATSGDPTTGGVPAGTSVPSSSSSTR